MEQKNDYIDLIEMAKMENANIEELFRAAYFRGFMAGREQVKKAIKEM